MVFNIQRYCVNDGPGVRTAVFLKGCPLDCVWCHNPESKSPQPQILYDFRQCINCGGCEDACPKSLHRIEERGHTFVRKGCLGCGACARVCPGALSLAGRAMTVETVMTTVLRDQPFYGTDGGMTVSGGEPFAQASFLIDLLSAARNARVGTCVETSGFAAEKDVRASLPLVDWYLYDCKETDAALHRKWTGVDNARILTNLAILDEANAQVVLRCPIVPGCNDREDHFRALGEMSRRFKCIRRIDVLPYHPLGVRKSRELGAENPCESIPFPAESDVELWKNTIGGMAVCPVCRG